MTDFNEHDQFLRTLLADNASDKVALASQRFFPEKIAALGVSNGDVMRLTDDYVKANLQLTPECRLAVAQLLIAQGQYHEEVLMGFALIRKVVKKHFDDALLERFEYWLEHYVSNWAQCDDLCSKVIYPFFLARTHLITKIGHWADADSPWTRRAANVALIKFICRKIGKTTYWLPKSVIFDNSQKLLLDPEPYVQKSIGWLLKVTAEHHRDDVVDFITNNIANLDRHTLRYAIEKLPQEQRKALMSMGK